MKPESRISELMNHGIRELRTNIEKNQMADICTVFFEVQMCTLLVETEAATIFTEVVEPPFC